LKNLATLSLPRVSLLLLHEKFVFLHFHREKLKKNQQNESVQLQKDHGGSASQGKYRNN
jgi:ABC-type sulfate transport system substrate-binding protein